MGIRKVGFLVLAVAYGLAFSAVSAQAAVLDLTDTIEEGFLNGGLFSRINQAGSGTGNINAFVQVGDNATVVEAYNTTVNNVLNNKSSDTHNHEITLSQVPIITIDDVAYREFLLDLGEPGEDEKRFISLDEIQIFLSDDPNQDVESFTGAIIDIDGDLIFRLDGNGDHYILLDSTLAGGQGQRDMFAYIPNSLFSGSDTQFVYLYSKFGINAANDGAFQEWALRVGVGEDPEDPLPTPEPGSLMLLASGFGALGLRRFRRKN